MGRCRSNPFDFFRLLRFKMKRVSAALIAMGLLLWLSGPVLAGGSRASARPGAPKVSRPALGVAPAPPVLPGRGRHAHAPPGYLSYPHHYYYYPPYYRYYRPPVVIVAPSYQYPYYAPATVLLSSPFYCFTHHEGFVSRVGFIDHVGGIHRIPLDTVASLCADGSESCVIE
jgi:hypothetical protein